MRHPFSIVMAGALLASTALGAACVFDLHDVVGGTGGHGGATSATSSGTRASSTSGTSTHSTTGTSTTSTTGTSTSGTSTSSTTSGTSTGSTTSTSTSSSSGGPGSPCMIDVDCTSNICGGGACCAQACAVQGPGTCNTNGYCDNSGACEDYPSGTDCGTTCQGVVLKMRICDGQGHCQVGMQMSCAPYACQAEACLTSCTGDSQCAGASWCSGATCLPRRPSGDPCSAGDQCTSGVCVATTMTCE